MSVPAPILGSDGDTALRTLLSAPALVAFDFDGTLAPIVEQSGGELEFVGEDVAIGGGIGMGVRESDTDLKATFDKAIAAMKEDGSLNELLKKWFGEESQTWE